MLFIGDEDLMADSGLRIPYALSLRQDIVTPNLASKRMAYFCPECGAELIVRSGTRVRQHFAHKRIPENCRFLNEGWLHISAKHAVKATILQWIAGDRESPVINRECRNCYKNYSQILPPRVRKVELEYRIESPAGFYVADVALLDNDGNPICVIEIRDTHEVDDEKRAKLKNMPWMELQARDALIDPTSLTPIEYGNLRGTDCPQCREAKKSARKLIIVRRGWAIHVDGCPIRIRVWHGKSYANVIDDCSGCEYLVGMDHGDDHDGRPAAIYCSAK
ncbi:competence protein CoiA family protein [Alicyclobacillus tolerans]|uniref:SsDNA-binding Zn-finger/Zn-ribbon topoisomerase 1 n=1 Tax=Alicyclobacillus tolerans TaxID=90970 RepID=A0ABT9LZI5_9BACL|nr:competence protein CoiA family protein [Alicyclobacillus tengchongensis]MDP9729683.1 ssDNA-binding Zn-finger/Zn-ribbon topoisomerase 1 [Alicyclobacillus tengchongensis]